MVVVTSSPGAHAMSPAATTRTPLSASKPAADDRAPDDGDADEDADEDAEGGVSPPPPPSPGLHATTSDNAATDTSTPILLRLLTSMNLITPPSSPKGTSG